MIETRRAAHAVTVAAASQRKRINLSDVLFWVGGIVLAFVVPLILILGAVFVSSWGIPLPIEVRIP